MFKAKVFHYSNVNWKENKFEKEFDNEREYQEYIRWEENTMFSSDWWNVMNFNKYLDDFFNRKILWFSNLPLKEDSNSQLDNSIVDISKYEEELQKIEYDKKNKESRKRQLEGALFKLKDYKKRFKDEWREDMIGKIDEDIKRIDAEIKAL